MSLGIEDLSSAAAFLIRSSRNYGGIATLFGNSVVKTRSAAIEFIRIACFKDHAIAALGAIE